MIEEELDELFDELKILLIAKNKDYKNSFHLIFEDFGLLSSYIRMTDKLNRLKNLAKNNIEVKDEKVIDTLNDLVNYGILTLIEIKNKK